MRFKTYIGAHTDLTRLIGEAQHELGPEAVIKTEYFTEGGFFGIGARKMVRVTAGVEDHPGESPFSIVARAIATTTPAATAVATRPLSDSPWHPPTNGTHPGKTLPAAELTPDEPPHPPVTDLPLVPPGEAEPEPGPAPALSGTTLPSPHAAVPEPEPELPFGGGGIAAPMADIMEALPAAGADMQAALIQAVLSELRALRGEVDALRQDGPGTSAGPDRSPAFSGQLQALYTTLIDRELPPDLARHLVETVDMALDDAAKSTYAPVAEAAIAALVAHCLERDPVAAPAVPATGQRVLMLIGPTGVGKTTTLAKLAARFHLVDDQRIALITADTFRIGAADQLRTFAQIINLPLDVVFNPGEFAKALSLHVDADVILVDTAGRSPQDEDRLADLRRFLAVDHPVETLLVVAATTKAPDLRLILDRFGAVPLDGLIVTKLDETVAIGPVLQLLWETRLPVRYLTNGQNVPDDLIREVESVLIQRLAEQLVR